MSEMNEEQVDKMVELADHLVVERDSLKNLHDMALKSFGTAMMAVGAYMVELHAHQQYPRGEHGNDVEALIDSFTDEDKKDRASYVEDSLREDIENQKRSIQSLQSTIDTLNNEITQRRQKDIDSQQQIAGLQEEVKKRDRTILDNTGRLSNCIEYIQAIKANLEAILKAEKLPAESYTNLETTIRSIQEFLNPPPTRGHPRPGTPEADFPDGQGDHR